jgi:hypothetical protein
MTATTVTNLDGSKGAAPMRPLLAQGRVRFVGEPVAVVIADSINQARDAAESVLVEYDALPVHLDLKPGGHAVHAEAPDNLAFYWGLGQQAATEAAFSKAVHHVKLRIDDNRVIVNSLEPRGCFAEWDGQRLHLAVNGQGVWNQKTRLVEMLGLAPEQVRVTNPDVGGGFGMKAMTYPEYYCVAHAAMALGRPVIASAVGGVYSVVRDGETGLVVPPQDSGALARQILGLLDDPVRARTIGEAGRREVIARFGTGAMIDRTVAVYNDVVEPVDTRAATGKQTQEDGLG